MGHLGAGTAAVGAESLRMSGTQALQRLRASPASAELGASSITCCQALAAFEIIFAEGADDADVEQGLGVWDLSPVIG